MKNSLLLLFSVCLSFPAFAWQGIERDTTPDTLRNDIPIITLAETAAEAEAEADNVSSLLSASNDLFTNVAAFNFGVARFRLRGYDNDASQIYVNGSSMNDLETGATYWSIWGGLNDVFRNREVAMGLDATDFAFGGLNGATNMEIGAASQRKQTRVSYATSNRSYFHRVMAVWSPELKNDFHLTLSGSRRWAQEGYFEGTFYDSWSYFMGLEKVFRGTGHSLALNFLGAPTDRGIRSAATLELYELAGTNSYNPNWGYQDGKKRNARVASSHQPMAVMRHKWDINSKSTLTSSLTYQFGRNGSTRMNWNNAGNPDPAYYRNMPSWFEFRGAPEAVEAVRAEFLVSPEKLQLDWDAMFFANAGAETTTIRNSSGIAGNDISGKQAVYFLEEQRNDRNRFDLNINFNSQLTDNIRLSSGAYFRRQNTHNYRLVNDLLGADFHLDVDLFASRDFPGDITAAQSNLATPDRVAYEGDIYGYNYDMNVRQAGAWGQLKMNLSQLDLFLALDGGQRTFWREGFYQNGRSPNNSLGKSDKEHFLEYGAKLGATYKLDGRNYLFANATRTQRAPSARDAFLSPRVRNDVVAKGLDTEKTNSVEGGYWLRAPKYKARLTGYYTTIEDAMSSINFYNDDSGTFGKITTTGINRQHIGLELAAEAEIFTGLSLQGVVALGQYTYTNRPVYYETDDVNALNTVDGEVAYLKNFYVDNTPQRAYSAGIRYSSPKFWFANLSFNYFDEIYLSMDPRVRTVNGAAEFNTPGTNGWYENLSQVELDNQYTLDLFGGKSWMIQRDGKRSFIRLTVGVNNILNNRSFATGGFEQTRNASYFTAEETARYYYAYGINYFAMLAYQF